MLSPKMFRVSEVACLLCFCVAPIRAQISRNGVVAGVVTGPDGSPVPAATISLTSVDGQVRKSAASLDGSFTLNDLPSGSYLAPRFNQWGKPKVTTPRKKARDAAMAHRLWELSVELTGCDWPV